MTVEAVAANKQNDAAAIGAFKRFGDMVSLAGKFAVQNLSNVGIMPFLQPQDLAENALAQFQTLNMNHFFDLDSVMPVDITDQPVDKVKERLKNAGMTVKIDNKTSTTEGAKTFEDMMRPIPAKSNITLFTNKDNTKVTGFRINKGAGQ
jgi:hypothetical protein